MSSVASSGAIRPRYFNFNNISNSLNQNMKIEKSNANVILIFAAAVTALFVAGCAGVGSANTTSLLTAAGFRARTPQTPQQQQIYAALPPYQVHRATVKEKPFTFTKTRKRGLPTSAGNRNTSVTASWRFSSRLPKTITWQRKWTVQPHLVGTEHGARARFGGKTSYGISGYDQSPSKALGENRQTIVLT